LFESDFNDNIERVGICTSALALDSAWRVTELLTILANNTVGRDLFCDVKEETRDAFNKAFESVRRTQLTREFVWTQITRVHFAAFGDLLPEDVIQKVLDETRDRLLSGTAGSYSWSDAEKKVRFDLIVGAGEVMAAELLAALLEFEYLDAYEITKINGDGSIDYAGTRTALRQAVAELNGRKFVCAGFIGTNSDDGMTPMVLERGGTDITAAVFACALQGVSILEVRKEVRGIFPADPGMFAAEKQFQHISETVHRAIRESGAQPLHADALSYIRRYDPRLTVSVCSSDDINLSGTMIKPDNGDGEFKLTMMQGSKKFTAINIGFEGFNNAVGALAFITGLFDAFGVAITHMATGVDSVMIMVATHELDEFIQSKLTERLNRQYHDRRLEVSFANDLRFINIVGQGLGDNNVAVLANIFAALRGTQIKRVRAIDVGGSSFSIVIGIDQVDYVQAYQTLYSSLFEDM